MELTNQLLRAEDPHVAENVAEHLHAAVDRYVGSFRYKSGIRTTINDLAPLHAE